MTLQPFTFPDTGQPVRAVDIDGEPWFIAADVCTVLGVGNPSQAVSYLDDDERGSTLISSEGGQQRPTNIVNEPGLYSLILRSRKPEARAFKRWVTHDVLPSIRRTGGYGAAPDRAELSRRDLAQMVLDEADRAEIAEQRAAQLEPDAELTRRTVDADGLRLVGQVAKAWGMQEKQLRQYLYTEGLLIRGGHRRNDPTAYAIEREWLVSKSRLAGQPERKTWTTYVTPRGEVGIWRRRYSQGLEDRPQPPSTQLSLVSGDS